MVALPVTGLAVSGVGGAGGPGSGSSGAAGARLAGGGWKRPVGVLGDGWFPVVDLPVVEVADQDEVGQVGGGPWSSQAAA